MVLITGGNGAIGSRLSRALVRRGRRVRVFALPNPSADTALREIGIDVVYGEITRIEEIRPTMTGVETVFHLAAILASPEKPDRFRSVNVEGTRRVLEAAIASGAKHFVFVSSISVTYPRRNPYSASKAEAEEIILHASIPWTIARPCLVIEGAEYRAFAAALRRWPLVFLPRGGAARKRPIRVEALAEALARMEGNPRCFGKTYALGGEASVSLREMAGEIMRSEGRSRPIVAIPEWPLRILAVLAETAARMTGRRFSWLCGQSVDGLVFDAAPETEQISDAAEAMR